MLWFSKRKQQGDNVQVPLGDWLQEHNLVQSGLAKKDIKDFVKSKVWVLITSMLRERGKLIAYDAVYSEDLHNTAKLRGEFETVNFLLNLPDDLISQIEQEQQEEEEDAGR